MSDYMPKVGDKVRAVLGENVLVGDVIVVRKSLNYAEIEVDGLGTVSIYDDWHFEQIVSVPSKFGAVIRRADGTKFLTYGSEDWYNEDGDYHTPGEVTAGGFTVLFDGVDE